MKIVTSIPVPHTESPLGPIYESTGGRSPVYPFGLIPVGEYFNVSGDALDIKRVKTAASIYGKRNGMRFATRMQPDGSVSVYRVK